MIRAILFDLDNTLTDFMLMKKASVESAVDAMIKAGLELNKEEALSIIYDIYAEKGIEYHEVFEELLSGMENSEKILKKGIFAYRKTRKKVLKPYDYVEDTLKELKDKGVKLAIVSDAPRRQAMMRLNMLKIKKYFDVIVTYDDTGEFKPSIKPFQKAINKLNVKPYECIMIGDNKERDIKGAENFGIKASLQKKGNMEEVKNEIFKFLK